MPRGINCRRCGRCAVTTKGLNISLEEAKRIGSRIRLEDFQQGKKIPLDKKGNCIALEKRGEKSYCKIYRQRPNVCRQYPLIFFNGRAIIQSDCTAAKELLKERKSVLSRKEIEKIPFLAKSLKELEKRFTKVKKQEFFEITNA